ncbi:MAG TPA: hypothetical protein VK471_08325 [Solirubrobacterales bacterium]|nr:hypothetical protein [Solirubrobacterales bacterium]
MRAEQWPSQDSGGEGDRGSDEEDRIEPGDDAGPQAQRLRVMLKDRAEAGDADRDPELASEEAARFGS